MAKKGARSDLITGAFAVFVIVSAIFVVMFLQAVGPRVEGARYSIRFRDVGGLGGNAPVIVAGQKVGKVEKIETRAVVESDGHRAVEVLVGIIIEDKFVSAVAIPSDTVAAVQMGGLFGGTQLVLRLGKSKTLIQPGGTLAEQGQPPVDFNTLLDSAQSTIKKLQTGLEKLAEVLNDDAFQANIKASLESLKTTLASLDKGLKDLEPAFKQVGPTIENANALVVEMRELLKNNNEAITSAIKHLEGASKGADDLLNGDAKLLVADLRKIAENLDKLAGNLNSVVLDNQGNIAISINNVREATESIRVFARRIEKDPSLLIWGSDDKVPEPNAPAATKSPDVDEAALKRSGRLPRRDNE